MPDARVSVDHRKVAYLGVRGNDRTWTYVDPVSENHLDWHARPGVNGIVVALRLDSGSLSKKPEYELPAAADRSDQEPGLGVLFPILMSDLSGLDTFRLVIVDQRVVLFGPDVADDVHGNWAAMCLFEEIEQDGDGVVTLPQDLVPHDARAKVVSFD